MKSRDFVSYRRARFSTRLPTDRLYTASHFWIAEEGDSVMRIGFTKFATRMLGELVEYGFEVQPQATIEVGLVIGWVEGFKAAADLFSVVDGQFLGENPELGQDISRLRKDPYGKGWLYRTTGSAESRSMDFTGYVSFLDETIDRIRGQYE